MTRRLKLCARALSVMSIAASIPLLKAQTPPTEPPVIPATKPDVPGVTPAAPATAPTTQNVPLPATLPSDASVAVSPTSLPSTVPSLPAPSTTLPAASGPVWPAPEASTTQPVTVLVPSTQPAQPNLAIRPAQKISLEFKDAAVDSVLDYLSEAAGFIVVKETPVDGKVTVVSRGPITPAEALTLLNAVLKPNGFTAIQQGRVLKVVKRESAKKQNIPVQFGADPEMIQETDELITQVVPVKNVDASKLRQDLQPLISADADFTANQGSNSLILTDSSANIKRIVKIVEKLDQHEAMASDIRIFQLTFANAASAAKLVTSVFAPDQQPGQQSGQGGPGGGGGPGAFFRRMMMQGGPGGPGGGAAAGQDSGKSTGKVTAAADDRTNTLVVTAPTDTLKLIDQLIKTIDSDPAALSEVRVFLLKFADATSAAKLLNTIFETDNAQGGNNQQAGGSVSHLPAFGGLSQTMRGGRVNAAADDRTNTLVVTAPSEAMRIITGILKELDSNPAAEAAFFIYHLRNGVATDLQGTLNTMFGGSTGGGGSSNNSGFSNNNRTAGQSLTSSGLGSNSGFGASGGRTGGGAGGQNGGFGAPLTSTNNNNGGNRNTNSGGGTGNGPTRATSELAGQASKYEEKVRKIIEELDRPVPQVLIKVLVAEVTHDKTNDFGVDFSIINTRPSGKGTTVGQQLGNAAVGTANGGLIVSLMEDNLTATLHALATQGKLDVLSRPYILASDNQLASITVGQEVPFITNTQIGITGQQTNTIQYQAVGIILNVTPHISPDGLVVLDVSPEISQLTGTTVAIGNGISAPVIANRSAQSRVAIRNGHTIVIGGMMQDQKTTTISKIPLLGDIPILGQIFTRYIDDRSKTELLIFLTPHVALEPDTLKGMSEDELKGTKLTPEAVEKGAFEDHMRGLQRGSTPTNSSTRPASVSIRPSASTQPLNGVTVTEPAPAQRDNRPSIPPTGPLR